MTEKMKLKEGLSYEVVVRDKRGKILEKIAASSQSYVSVWNQCLYVLNRHTSYTITDTGGTGRSVSYSSSVLRANAGVGEIDHGIRVGKGTTPITINDYALEAPCGEGTGVDQFLHQAMAASSPAVVVSDCSFWVRRVMVNNSGSTISGIREIGCYVMTKYSPRYCALGYRDVLPGSVSVPDGGSVTVTYTLKVTV
ncbi:MAG: hypothetical protein D4R38_00475 [Dehalococcoidia bacterium]|nr:MAG: hypothetical protein D4R38_00475 [Dehalococcoidia bacterium]